MKVHLEALAYLTSQNPTASIVFTMALARYDGTSTFISPSQVEKATGIHKGSVSRAIKYLVEQGYMVEDPECEKLYYLSSRIAYTFQKPCNTEIPFFTRLSAPEGSRKAFSEVEMMNQLSDEEIAEVEFDHGHN